MEKTRKKISQLTWPKYHKPKDKNMGWTKQKPLERRQSLSSQKHMTRTWKFMTKTFELISNDIEPPSV